MIAHNSHVGIGPNEPDLIRPELLQELFEQQAELRSGETALWCEAQRMTYGELETRANQLARLLRQFGSGSGSTAGLLLPRSMPVYVGLLGILKSGAAYVPLDPGYPEDRVGFILDDCQARVLLTTRSLAAKARSFKGQILVLDELDTELASQPPTRLSRLETGLTPQDLCYIIYTSGTTGRPKGVQVEHRNVCHLVRAEAQIFQVRPEDRVYQGFSIAFDASVEEIWLAFFAGATLVVGTEEMRQAGPALPRWLTTAGVTVLSCVPTLLAMMDEDIPSVRLLILGGETCPPDLVKRWWKSSRRVVNTYGPTEATVIATYGECHPARPVTIGRPIPNCVARILDEQMLPVSGSATGELWLGGAGVARGYLGRPELTREKFVSLALPDGSTQRLYRTGDLARWTPEGEIEFLGRADTQVKLRGFRVELSEIESVLMEIPGVKAAAVTLHKHGSGLEQLIGYLVAGGAEGPGEEDIRAVLRARLPAYMVPALLEWLPALPTLPSGKVDRRTLPPPQARSPEIRRDMQLPRTETERQIAGVWNKLFAPLPVSTRDNFFLDLGGHSLLAARMVSELRNFPNLQHVSMLDAYQHPTIEGLAAVLEKTQGCQHASRPHSPGLGRPVPALTDAPKTNPVPENKPQAAVPFWRHFACGAAQLFTLIFILTFFALQWLTPYLTYTVLIEEDYEFPKAVLGAFVSLILFYPLMLAIPIAAKWLVIGRYQAGSYPLWGTYYFRWWLVTTLEAAVPVGYLSGTPLLNIYLRLMGAKVGQNVHLASSNFAVYDLLSIGAESSINADARLLGYTIENAQLKLGRIAIGQHCFIGTRSAVCEETVMENGAALEDLSLLPRGATIPAGETWLGSPARPVVVARSSRGALIDQPTTEPSSADTAIDHQACLTPPTDQGSAGASPHQQPNESEIASVASAAFSQVTDEPEQTAGRRLIFGLLHAAGVLTFPVLVVAALFPGIVVMNKLNYIDLYYWYLFLAPLVGASFILLLALEIVGLKWLLLGRVKPGRYPLHSLYYLRKWFVDQTMDLSIEVLGPLYASIYLKPWYTLLGARLGQGTEISTASFISPDLLSIGDESFIADSVSLGAPRVNHGWVTIGKNHIGRRSFIGNSAMLPPGTVIGDNVLIGCLSAPPPNPADAQRADTAWLGSPPLFLPERQKSAAFPETATFHPPAKLRALRAAIEFVRVITPSTGFIILISLLFSALLLLHDHFSLTQTLLLFPFLYLACALAAALFTLAAKWILVGRYRPTEKPLWSTFVWRNELVNALHEHLAEPFLVSALGGTPFICWYFRLLGAHIGRRVYMETTDLTEFDLVHIGDEAALNADCTIQTHLFEDRVMKMSTIQIASRCKVGGGSLVLYDTRMEPGAELGDLSLLMKGEVLPAETKWEGIPARRRELSRRLPSLDF